jgi:hypothetical protein
MIPILCENSIHLRKLELENYTMLESREFHQALALQPSLQVVKLQGDSEGVYRDDIDALVDSLTKLTKLRDLELREVSDYFHNEQVIELARHLVNLEELVIGGFCITDQVWPELSRLRSLRSLCFTASTSFTAEGILGFISKLGPGNSGLVLSVMNEETSSDLSEDSLISIRQALFKQVEGKFEFVLNRGEYCIMQPIRERILSRYANTEQDSYYSGDSD